MKPCHEPAPRTSGSGSRRPSDSPDGPTRRGSSGPRGVAPVRRYPGINETGLLRGPRNSPAPPLGGRMSERSLGPEGECGERRGLGRPVGTLLACRDRLGGARQGPRNTRVTRVILLFWIVFPEIVQGISTKVDDFPGALRRRRVRPPRRKAGRRRRSQPWRGRPRPSPAGPPGRPGRRRPWRRGLRGARGRRG